ncbi:hypothetical protein BGZ51_003221 [Haplosporangium sp. Z 767]|nr:hypothetical protein BGZ51_003221 [Haplosporangium sp. Z 767]
MPPAHRLIKSTERPKVLIVGAGLGGTTLAILLEKAGVPYDVYERAAEVKTLGAAHFLGPNMAPLFRQIGIYEEFVSKAKPCNSIDVFDEDRKLSFIMDFSEVAAMGGSEGYIIPRSVLYDILLNQVPKDRIHRGKRVLSIMQNEDGVMLRFADGTTAGGDILVGADGAYSAVRQSLYKQLQKSGKLADELVYSSVNLVGQTLPLDPVKYPELNEPVCHFNRVLGYDRPYAWATWTTKDNVMCWSVSQYLDNATSRTHDTFMNTDWGPEKAEAMTNLVREFPIPGGDGTLTLGGLIDNTPKAQISKVALEEKVFETWYHGRTINPAGGQGALLAMHDAIALANWINVLSSTSIEDAEEIFREFKEERYPAANAAYAMGAMMAQISAKTFKAKIARFIARNMPKSIWRVSQSKNAACRPQVSFLPLVEDSGTVKPQYQPSLEKTRIILEDKEKREAETIATL